MAKRYRKITINKSKPHETVYLNTALCGLRLSLKKALKQTEIWFLM